MSTNITDYRFVLYERLAHQKLNEILSQLNSHNHGAGGGVALDMSEGAAVPSYSVQNFHLATNSVDGRVLQNNSVTTDHIVDGTITIGDLNLTSIKLTADGYAVYAP